MLPANRSPPMWETSQVSSGWAACSARAAGRPNSAQQASWRHAADRRDVARFADWSMRRELSEHGQPDERLSWTRGIAA